MTTKPYDWIQTVSDALIETGQIPLWGTIPPFPWEEFSRALKDKFSSTSFEASSGQVMQRDSSHLFEGMGASPLIIPLNATPLEGTLFWAVSFDDAKRIISKLLTTSKETMGFTDEVFVRGFFDYLTLEILETLQGIHPFHDLSLTVGERGALPTEDSLCIDVKIMIEGQSLWGRLICPHTFQKGFKQYFAHEKVDITSKRFASSLDVTLQLEAGLTTLSYQEWQTLKEGDFVFLENCVFDPASHKGIVGITLGSIPLFQARFKEGTLKILDYAYFGEEEELMDEPASEENKNLPKDPMDEEGSLPPEESMEGEGAEHLWSEGEHKMPLEELLPTSDIPISLTVEVGRLHMTLEKLLELEPGNTLELTTRPEDGVNVTMKGKRVAHAELIKIGEVLGIRILKLGR